MDSDNLTTIARKLRNRPTEAEKRLWYYLRNRQLGGFKFRRQQPIGHYVVDFLNFEKNIIIELDGGQHKALMTEDKIRDDYLRRQGYKVLRFWNSDVLKNTEGTLEAIKKALNHPSPIPSRKGRGTDLQ